MPAQYAASQSLIPLPSRLSSVVISIPAAQRAYAYFRVHLPYDVTEPDLQAAQETADRAVLAEVLAERHLLACQEAAERARSWCVSAWWHVVFDDGSTVVVRRISRRVR